VGVMPQLQRVIEHPAERGQIIDLSALLLAAHADLCEFIDVERLEDVPADRLRTLMGRFGWLVSTFRTISIAHTDGDRLRFCAVLAAAVVWDGSGRCWARLAPMVGNDVELADALAQFLLGVHVGPVVSHDTPTGERAHLDMALNADAWGDWPALVDRARAFEPVFHDVVAHAVRGLCVINEARLAVIASRMPTWFSVAALIRALDIEDALRVARQSRAPRVWFAVLEYLANRYQAVCSLTQEIELCDLLETIAQDDTEWRKFMLAFNRYPVRHGFIQRALGRALSHGRLEAIHAYVDAIDMDIGGLSAREVASCLEEFARQASIELQHALWERAFHRWSAWNFGEREKRSLMDVGRSALDYAVIRWLVDCMPETEIRAELAVIDGRIAALSNKWFESSTEFRTAACRLLSRYVLFDYARALKEGAAGAAAATLSATPAALTSSYAQAMYAVVGLDATNGHERHRNRSGISPD